MDSTTPQRTMPTIGQSPFKRRLARLIRMIPAIVVYFDRQGLIVDVSDTALQAFGYLRQDVIDQPVSDFLSMSDSVRSALSYPEFWQTDGHMLDDIEVRHSNGSTHRMRATVAIDIDPKEGVVGAVASLEAVPQSSKEAQREQGPPYSLTPRQLDVLEAAANGLTDRQIGELLNISPETVHKHVSHSLVKMNAISRTDACVRGVLEGWLLPSRGRAALSLRRARPKLLQRSTDGRAGVIG